MGENLRTINVAGRKIDVPVNTTGIEVLNKAGEFGNSDLVRVDSNEVVPKNARISVKPGENFSTQPVTSDGRG